MLKIILIAAGGTLLGALITFFIVKRAMAKKAEAEKAELKRQYDQLLLGASVPIASTANNTAVNTNTNLQNTPTTTQMVPERTTA